MAGAAQLRAELRVRRHLLEQPPPHAGGGARVGGCVLDEPVSALPVGAVPIRHGLMGKNHFDAEPAVACGTVPLIASIT